MIRNGAQFFQHHVRTQNKVLTDEIFEENSSKEGKKTKTAITTDNFIGNTNTIASFNIAKMN